MCVDRGTVVSERKQQGEAVRVRESMNKQALERVTVALRVAVGL